MVKQQIRLIAVGLVCALMCALNVPAAYAAGTTEYREGHVDAFFVRGESGELKVTTKYDTGFTETLHNPEDVLLITDASAYTSYEEDELPQGALPGGETKGYISFLGYPYMSPGWGSNDLAAGGFSDVRVEFTSVEAPEGGRIALYTSPMDGTLAALLHNAQGGDSFYLEAGAHLDVPTSGHGHMNWFYTRSGDYTVHGYAVGTRDGVSVQSQPFALKLRVEHSEDEVELGENLGGSGETGGVEPSVDAGGDGDSGEVAGGETPSTGGETNPEVTEGGEGSGTESGASVEDETQPAITVASGKVALDHGHIDAFNVLTDGDQLRLLLKEDVTAHGTLRNPGDVTVNIGSEAYTVFPTQLHNDIPQAGYYLDAAGSKQTELPFPGWDTTQVRWDVSPVNIEFLEVKGPGDVYLFQSRTGVGPVSVLNDGGFELKDGSTIEQKDKAHQHGHWIFTKPGTYTMQVRAAAPSEGTGNRAADSELIYSDIQTYTWNVEASSLDTELGGNELGDSTEETSAGSTEDEPATTGTVDPSSSDTGKPVDVNSLEAVDRGHIDIFHVTPKGDDSLSLDAGWDIDGEHKVLTPESMKLVVKESTKIDVPESLQKDLPESGYLLGQSGNDQNEVVWPGWDTLGMMNSPFSAVDIVFEEVEGPGAVFLWQDGEFGMGLSSVLKDGGYQLLNGSAIAQNYPAHAHANWMFTEPGKYVMKVRAASGDSVSSATHTYTWIVGDYEEPKEEEQGSGDSENTGEVLAGNAGTAGDNAGSGAAASAQDQKQCRPVTLAGSGENTVLPRIKDDRTQPAAWVDPSSLTFAIGDAGKAKAPAAIGSIAQGSDVWMISSTQVAGVPWLGVNTQSPSLLKETNGATTFTLSSFSGPGTMEVFTSGNLGTLVGTKWFSGSGNQGSGTATIQPNTHVHPNWVFSKPGTYKVGITVSSMLNSGKKASGTATLTFKVGSGSGVTSGHFDFGPEIGPEGSKTVWQYEDGTPCTPSGEDLAKTGSESTFPMLEAALILTVIGAVAFTARRRWKPVA